MSSPLQLHIEKWSSGCGASICKRARRVCHIRGDIPCDVVMIGEAPGESENIRGFPFAGPAGHLLDAIVRNASVGIFDPRSYGLHLPFRFAYCNLVGCIPYEDVEGGGTRKAGQPAVEDIQSCQERLNELLEILQPSLVVCVGAMSRDWCKPGYPMNARMPKSMIEQIDIVHPAALLRMSVATRDFSIQAQVVRLANALERLQDNLTEGGDK